jgi:gluconate kinase
MASPAPEKMDIEKMYAAAYPPDNRNVSVKTLASRLAVTQAEYREIADSLRQEMVRRKLVDGSFLLAKNRKELIHACEAIRQQFREILQSVTIEQVIFCLRTMALKCKYNQRRRVQRVEHSPEKDKIQAQPMKLLLPSEHHEKQLDKSATDLVMEHTLILTRNQQDTTTRMCGLADLRSSKSPSGPVAITELSFKEYLRILKTQFGFGQDKYHLSTKIDGAIVDVKTETEWHMALSATSKITPSLNTFKFEIRPKIKNP